MPERSKGADLRSAGRQSAWVRTPLQAYYCPSGQMDKASVSGAEDCGFESHLGWRLFLGGGYFFTQCASSELRLRNLVNSCSLEAEHRSYEPGVAGSIPARSTFRRL